MSNAQPSTGNITTTTQNSNGILGAWATVAGASGNDWAANSGVANAAGGSNIVAYTGYTNDYTSTAATTPNGNYGWGAGNNTSMISTNSTTTNAVASGSTTNSLKFGASSNYTITLSGANTITSGGIILTGIGAAAANTIGGTGTLTVGTAANELDVAALGASASGSMTINAAILDNGSGTTSLTFTGSTLVLGNAGNTYGGATTINNGILKISADHDLGAPPATATPGDLVIDGAQLVATAGFTLNANRGIALGASGASGEGITVSTGTLAYAGTIANFGPINSFLAYTGPGTLALSGSNTYSGGTQISGGILNIASDAALGATTAAPNILLNVNGTLQLANGFSGALSSSRSILANGTLANPASIDTNGNGTSAAPIAYSGSLTVSGALAKAGSGFFELDSTPTLNNGGSLMVTGGSLRLTYASTPSHVTSFGASVSPGATLELAGAASQLSNAVNVTNAGTLLVSSTTSQTVGTVIGGSHASPTGATVVNGGSSLTAYQLVQNSLTIHGTGTSAATAGAVTLVPSGSGSTTNPTAPNNINFSSSLLSLSIDNNGGALMTGARVYFGTLDIGNNGLVIAYGSGADPYVNIDDMIRSGFDSAHWDGTGITSSLARAAANSHTPLNIGLLDFTPGLHGDGTFMVFQGQTVTTNAILVGLTYMDDINLFGDMSLQHAASDALLFAANFGVGTTWSVGDLTHDGVINSADALLFAANYATGLPSLYGTTGGATQLGSAVGGTAAVPEPASVLLAAMAAAAGLAAARVARRRKASL